MVVANAVIICFISFYNVIVIYAVVVLCVLNHVIAAWVYDVIGMSPKALSLNVGDSFAIVRT